MRTRHVIPGGTRFDNEQSTLHTENTEIRC